MGRTALHHVKYTPHAWVTRTVRLLLELGADPLAVDYDGAKPRDWLLLPVPKGAGDSDLVPKLSEQEDQHGKDRGCKKDSEGEERPEILEACLLLDHAARHGGAAATATAWDLVWSQEDVPRPGFKRRPRAAPAPSLLSASLCSPARLPIVASVAEASLPSSLAFVPEPDTHHASSPSLLHASTPLHTAGGPGTAFTSPPTPIVISPQRFLLPSGVVLGPLPDATVDPPLAGSRRVGAWYVLLLVDQQPATTKTDEAHGPLSAPHGRLSPLIVGRRVSVLENSTKADGQEKSVQLSQDPATGYAVAAAVGPVVVDGRTWAAVDGPPGAAVVRMVSQHTAEDVCEVLAACARKRMHRVAEAGCPAFKLQERGAAVGAPPSPASAPYSERAAHAPDDEVPMPHTACLQRGACVCDFSALRALKESLKWRDALTARSDDVHSHMYTARFCRRVGDADVVCVLNSLYALKTAHMLHVFSKWLDVPLPVGGGHAAGAGFARVAASALGGMPGSGGGAARLPGACPTSAM